MTLTANIMESRTTDMDSMKGTSLSASVSTNGTQIVKIVY